MKLQESGENYLEAILMIEQEKGSVRSIDVAERLNFSKPSVSHAVGLLTKAGYLTMGEGRMLQLTPEGRTLAERVYERHKLFTQFLIALGVDPVVAANDACRLEHALSEESFRKIKAFAEQHLQELTE